MSVIGNMVGGGNSGNVSRLPVEYQEVEYLQSSGTQGFLTGVYFHTNISIDVNFMFTSLVQDTDIIGCDGTASGASNFALILNNFSNHNRLIVGKESNNSTSSYSFTANTRYNAHVLMWESGTNVFINNFQWNYYGATVTSVYPLGLFCRTDARHGGVLTCFAFCRIYSCEIRDQGTLIRDFVPCYRKADSVAGMYDLVNDVFYTNEGTGSFVVGGDVA